MAIPEQVQKQSEAVQQLYADLNEEVKGTESEAGLETQPAEGEAVVAEAPADRVDEQATQSAPEEQTVADTQDDKSLEQKYKTLQGMYNAEIPRLHAGKRELADRVSQLERLLSTTVNKIEPTPATPVEPEKPQVLITEQDMEDYGDSIDVMRRVSKEESNVSNGRIAQLEQTIQQLKSNFDGVAPRVEQLSQQQNQSAEHSFWSALESNVPNWRDTNIDPDFQNWLLSIDPLTGISRQTYLEDAQSNFDVQRVSNFFSTWGENNGKPRAQKGKANSQVQLEKQVAPGKGKSTGTPTSTGDQTYAPSDIAQFYNDIKQGKYKGQDKERARIERDIFAAQRDGRIVTA